MSSGVGSRSRRTWPPRRSSKRNFAHDFAQVVVFARVVWLGADYGAGSRASRSKARRWISVGVARSAVVWSRPKRTVLRVSVARSARSDRKLWTGISSSVSLLAALRLAAADGWALATAEAR